VVTEKTNMVKYVIGERQVLAKMKNGEFRLVKLQVGLPEPLENRWQSEIALDGLYPNVVKVPGVDSFQCLNLAFGVVRTALEKFIESGGQLILERWLRPFNFGGYIFMKQTVRIRAFIAIIKAKIIRWLRWLNIAKPKKSWWCIKLVVW
jgi:hypothetical protein